MITFDPRRKPEKNDPPEFSRQRGVARHRRPHRDDHHQSPRRSQCVVELPDFADRQDVGNLEVELPGCELIRRAANDASFKQALERAQVVPDYREGADFAKFFEADHKRMAAVVKGIGKI